MCKEKNLNPKSQRRRRRLRLYTGLAITTIESRGQAGQQEEIVRLIGLSG